MRLKFSLLDLHSLGYYLLIVVSISFTSCKDEPEVFKPQILETSNAFLSRSAPELKTFIQNSGMDLDSDLLKYDVDIYKMTYKTMYRDEEILASGVVILPKTTDNIGMISFQHGTIVSQQSAPSALPLNSQELILYSALASSGFITVIPDYIGFGESEIYFHPYYVERATADAVIDNIRAAEELAKIESVKFNSRLFLAGYSQGGYATMAAHKYIEENGLAGLDLIASFPAAGGYDVKGMQEYFFAQQFYNDPHYIAYVSLSYKSYYGWSESVLSDLFKEPYAGKIPQLFNGSNTSSQINAQLTNSIADLLKEDLRANIDTKPEYEFLVNAFEENSLINWTPTKKMFMYHGDADITVPYQNSVETLQTFLSNGASNSIVSLITLDGATHNTGVKPYIEDMVEKLNTLK